MDVKLLKSTGYGMHQQVEYFNNCTFCPHCIYVFCIYLRTNKGLCHLHQRLISFYDGEVKCLQRGTHCDFNPFPVQFKSLLHGQEGCVFSVGI
jgi:hypothetical protein